MAGLKGVVEDITSVPESLREYYAAGDDGRHYLQAEGEVRGFVPRGRLEEFRNTNLSLKKQIEDLQRKSGAPEGRRLSEEPREPSHGASEAEARVKALEEEIEQLRRGAQKQPDLKALMERELAPLREASARQAADFKKQLDEAEKAKKEAEETLSRHRIDAVLTEAALNAGAIRESIPDLLLVAGRDWRWVDGKPVALKDGQVAYGTSGLEPMTPKEFMHRFRTEKKYYFESSSGGGATGNNKPAGGAGAFRLTRQQALDHNLYVRTKEAAEKAGQRVEIVE